MRTWTMVREGFPSLEMAGPAPAVGDHLLVQHEPGGEKLAEVVVQVMHGYCRPPGSETPEHVGTVVQVRPL